jgi:signal transduction histidine kinase
MKQPLTFKNDIHDITETSNRTLQFGVVALLFAFITIVANIINRNFLSTWLVTGLFVSMGLILLLNKKGYGTLTKISTVVIISVFITLLAFAEGLKAGGYLYFLPVLFALPFLVNNSRYYTLELATYFMVPITCFGIVLFFCEERSSWQHISDDVYKRMFYTNSFCIMLLCAVFAYLSIYLERRYAAALVEQKEKAEDAVEARTKFLSNMGHELRTPLNGIIGATNLIRKEPANDEQGKYLDILKYCSDHMLSLVNDILDFNKIEQDKLELHPTKCNLKHILSQSTLPFYNRFEEKNLELRLIVDQRLDTTILVDDVRLVQVINNMLSNALKFTDNGYVKLEAQLVKEEPGLVHVLFAVEDTGIGIRKDLQDKIYNSFWQVYNESTRRYGGTGLGLTICQRLLQLMNSSLHVQSHEGKGSRFYFTIAFPVVKTTSLPNAVNVPDTSDLTGYRILVAEDNLINMMIVKKILEDWNAEITTCENGKIAIDTLEKDDQFSLVLMDLEMPEMDGYTALDIIRQKHVHLPVLAFTAALMDNVMFDDLIARGFRYCILKPFQPLQLLAKIKKHAFIDFQKQQ